MAFGTRQCGVWANTNGRFCQSPTPTKIMQMNKVELLLVISPDGLESTAIDPALVALEDSRNEKPGPRVGGVEIGSRPENGEIHLPQPKVLG